MIDGIKLEKANNVTLCKVENFSDEFKGLIRTNLAQICNGKDKSVNSPLIYSYKYTLEDFFLRFDSKSKSTKIGMIGELLSHILILETNDNLSSINPYFNMEEKSIKKGFDLVLIDITQTSKVWITEVKSGERGAMTCSKDKNRELLGVAKRDLKKRLNNRYDHIWHNAINGARVSMKESDLKKEIIKVLESSLVESREGKSKSDDKNVILTTVLFNDIADCIDIDSISSFCVDTEAESLFDELMVFSIQKSTIDKVVSFLRAEVA